MANDSFVVTKTASGTNIDLKYPDFPLRSFLLEIFVLDLFLIILAVLMGRLFPFSGCSTILVWGVMLSPFLIIWNYWGKQRLEITENLLTVNRKVLPGKWEKQRFRKQEVKGIRVIGPDEKLALFEGVFGLRLLSTRSQGMIGFETPQGMLVRFGWGLSNSEAEEIVSIIQQWLNES